ncbi:MAG: cytochrome c maturation protein CcmE [Pseudomonadota bacterium]
MTRKRRRMMWLGLCAVGLGTATALVLTAFEDNLAFFRSPTDIAERSVPLDGRIRLGGLVAAGSVVNLGDGLTVEFLVTDTAYDQPVRYDGILPDLFREGQGVVAEGVLLPDGVFHADTVLARHDETYMAPEVAEALERAGHGPLIAPAAAGTTTSEVDDHHGAETVAEP